MKPNEFDELAGRIEGLARVVLYLVARLEVDGLLDGQAFTAGLRKAIVLPVQAAPHLKVARTTLFELANALDEARGWRRFRRNVTPTSRPQDGRRPAA